MENSLCEKPERHAPRRLSDYLMLEGQKQKCPLSGGQGILTQELEACVGARSCQSRGKRNGWDHDRGI